MSDQKITLEDVKAMSKPTLTRAEVAKILEVDPRTVTVGVEQGQIPAIRLGRRMVIPREKFLALFEVKDG